ncbi:glycoside hydrolase family 65 protein [Neolewinella sp.]|uniref:glycoside hydrolase family 65 protein n=1 Tax=Neolewinella sp. TaxID=2993543 RepID=UPI003B528AC5
MRIFLLLFLYSTCVPAQWTITATDIDPANYYGITVANGMVGLVSSPEPMRVQDVVLNGVYDNYQRGRVSNILKTFNHMNMNLDVDGRRIGAGDIEDFQQQLDMQHAELVTTFSIGDSIDVRHTLLSLRHLPFTALAQVEITARRPVRITPASVIESPTHLRDVRNTYSEIDRPHVLLGLLTSYAESPTGAHTVAASTSFLFPEPHGREPRVIHEDWDFNMHLAKFHRQLAAGETYTFGVVGSTIASEHTADPLNEAERLTIFARLEGMDRLIARHRAAWAELWRSDIQIEGNLRDQVAVRSALYHLYSFARAGQAYSLSPMGLSGLGYNGHVFWDTEIWMYPGLLALQPGMARSIMQYRYDRLPAARTNAFMHGYDGAMFPWESADDGSEDTPVWALTGPFQHHISGDVAWAMWRYYQTTGDTTWLRTTGYPVMREVADFFVSRVEREGPGRYNINNVIGANEWEENIDNNAYTNGMAVTALRYAGDAAAVLGLEPDTAWAEVAANIPILTFPDGTTRENATYVDTTIKQADVNLLAWPMDIVREPTQIRKDLAFYEPRLSKDGPAMGKAILSLLYTRLGDVDKAYGLFEQSYQPNEVPPFGVLAETAGGTNPYFATGAGGMLQAVLFGFGGLDFTDGGIVQGQGRLPAAWTSLTITGVGPERRTFRVE